MRLIESKDNPYPIREIAGFTVIQAGPTLSFLVNDSKILRFEHREGILSDSAIKNWINQNIAS